MIDLHCHIIHGLDDGPETFEESLAMCRIAAADGIKTIVATPHYRPGMYDWTEAAMAGSINELNNALRSEGLDLTILPGAELPVFPELPAKVTSGSYLTINKGRYCLIEFNPHSVPPNWETFLSVLLNSSITPVLAHPERNIWFINHPEALTNAVRMGVVLQITASSITGEVGREVQDFSAYLLRRSLVRVISSDAHGSQDRPPLLSAAVSLAEDIVGRGEALAMVTSAPEAIISGAGLPLLEPREDLHDDRGPASRWLSRLFGGRQ